MSFHVTAKFITSSAELSQCPEPLLPEYAFIGRSNVGKSSLINMITGQKTLAKTSSTPGKTQLINHFLVDDQWYLVDLPGYGYARTGRKKRKKWEALIEQYLIKRKNLISTFILVDSRLPMQESDRQVINWFGENQLHFILVMTKADKLSSRQRALNLEDYQKEIMTDWEELPPMIVSSAKTGSGKKEIFTFIEETNKLFAR